MEKLDIYDENGQHLGTEDRAIVHRDALWHKTVHCWLYDAKGSIFFQIRKKEGKLYTTASGHILAGETVKEGFGREIEEEIGIKVDYDKATLIDIVHFVMDRPEKDGSVFRDRAFANVYCLEIADDEQEFKFDETELLGLVKLDAKDTLDLLKKERGSVEGTVISLKDGVISREVQTIDFDRFLVNPGETAITKYGTVLEKIISLT